MRHLAFLLCVFGAVLAAPPPVAAQGYVERKDHDAVDVIERAMAAAQPDPRLFDGARVPPGADLLAVRELADRFAMQLRGAERAAQELSPEGRQRATNVLDAYARWSGYGRALIAGHQRAAAAADQAERQRAAVAARDQARGVAICTAFREVVLADPSNRQSLDLIARIADGSGEYWQTVAEGAEHLATMQLAAAQCARPDFGDVGAACAYLGDASVPERRWCSAVRDPDAIMKASARNLVADHVRHLAVGRSADELERFEGWLEVEGGVTWAWYFAGGQARASLGALLGPVLAQAGLPGVEDTAVFAGLDAHYRALEAKVRALAPTWPVPGVACKGVACAAAKKGVLGWNAGARLRKLTQREAGWQVVQDGLGRPTHRWKSGFALIERKGDPLCQLRSWTVTELHRGGGRYQAATTAELGYVRWQACR